MKLQYNYMEILKIEFVVDRVLELHGKECGMVNINQLKQFINQE